MAAVDPTTREESPPVDEEISSVPYFTTLAARRMTVSHPHSSVVGRKRPTNIAATAME